MGASLSVEMPRPEGSVTDQDIIVDWLSRPINRDKLPVVGYPKQIHDFIKSCGDRFETGGDVVYKVFGVWQKIKVL